MTNESAFIAACLAEPEEDLPKLVFADWLEEHGRHIEAWRIRAYLQEYRAAWKKAIRWSGLAQGSKCRSLIEQVVHPRQDELWRLVCLTLVEAILDDFPLALEQVAWEHGWDSARYHRTLAEAKCRVILHACGVDANLQVARVSARAAQIAASHGSDPQEDAAIIASYLDWTAVESTEASHFAVMIALNVGRFAATVAAQSLWTHICTTNPEWG